VWNKIWTFHQTKDGEKSAWWFFESHKIEVDKIVKFVGPSWDVSLHLKLLYLNCKAIFYRISVSVSLIVSFKIWLHLSLLLCLIYSSALDHCSPVVLTSMLLLSTARCSISPQLCLVFDWNPFLSDFCCRMAPKLFGSKFIKQPSSI
jgi:hypothetical protein